MIFPVTLCCNPFKNKQLKLISSLLIIGASFTAQASTVTPVKSSPKVLDIRLHEAIAYALKDNISVRSAYLSRIADKFSLYIARDQFNPQYSLGSTISNVSRFDKSTDQHLTENSAGSSAGVSLKNPLGGQLALTLDYAANLAEYTDDTYASGINLSYVQPLLRGGGYTVGRASLSQAEFSERNSVLALKSSLILVVGQVISSYRSYAQALRSLKISRLSLARSKQQVEVNKELIRAGRLAAVELIQSKTDLANQRLSLRSKENQLDSARVALLRLLRMDQSVQLKPTEPLKVVKVELDLKKLLKTALTNRSDYLQSLISLESSKLIHEIALNTQKWDLGLSAGYNLAGSNINSYHSIRETGHIDQGDFNVSLNLNIPIGDLSRRQSLVNARIQLIKSRNQHIDLKESINLQLVDAIRNIEILWDQVYLSRRSLELTTKQLELEQEKLKTGRSSNFQVVTYQNQLASAENQTITAQISYLNALTDLDSKLGTTLEHWGINIEPKSGLEIQNIEDYGL